MTEKRSNDLEFDLEPEDENRKNLTRISELASNYFHSSLGEIVLSSNQDNHENFSGDGASLYTLAVDKLGRKILVKLGWGEFSKTAFIKKYPEITDKKDLDWNQRIDQERDIMAGRLKKLPIEMFVVPQTESYLANERTKTIMADDPEEYLRSCSTLILDSGDLVYSKGRGILSRSQSFDGEVKAKSFSELAADFQNCIIEDDYNFEDFADNLRNLPQDPKAAFDYLKNHPDFFSVVQRLDVNKIGIAVGDENSMNSIIELKKRFDFKEKRFFS